MPAIKARIHIPLVADIHFDYKLRCCARRAASTRSASIRATSEPKSGCGPWRMPAASGASPSASASTAGHWKKNLLVKYGGVTAQALVDSAMGHVRLLNDCGFNDICISVKCSRVPVNMAAYRMLHEQNGDYPLHLGVTEAGTPEMGVLKSAIGIGGLLCMGVGDTLRVSLTAGPGGRGHRRQAYFAGGRHPPQLARHLYLLSHLWPDEVRY